MPDFRPLRLYLNTDTSERHLRARPHCQDARELSRLRNTETAAACIPLARFLALPQGDDNERYQKLTRSYGIITCVAVKQS